MNALEQSLFDLQTAEDLPDLRARFNRLALDFGFLGLAERSQPQKPGDPKHCGTSHFPWSNSVEFYGSRTHDYVAAVSNAFDETDPLEILIRRRWEMLRRAPFLLSEQPQNFEDNGAWLCQGVDFGEPAYSDALVVPLPAPTGEIRHLYFMSCDPITPEQAARGITLGSIYGTKVWLFDKSQIPPALAAQPGNVVELRPPELEVIRWSVAGKTLGETATITGFSYRTVRYHLDQACKRYGYATIQQTLVRAALDYGLDPLG